MVGGGADRDDRLVHHPGRVGALGAALLLVGATLGVVIAGNPARPAVQPLDDRWLAAMVGARVDALVSAGQALAFLGSWVVTLPVRVVAGVVLAWQRRWAAFVAFVGAMVTAELFVGPVKGLVDRPRPPDRLVTVSQASYPSGHAIAAGSTAFALVLAFVPAGRGRRPWLVLAAAVTVVMAWSRTYVAAHWLTDVVGGASLGVGAALCWSAGVERFRPHIEHALPVDDSHSVDPAGATGTTRPADQAAPDPTAVPVPALEEHP